MNEEKTNCIVCKKALLPCTDWGETGDQWISVLVDKVDELKPKVKRGVVRRAHFDCAARHDLTWFDIARI